MPRISTYFFTIGVLCALAGMVWGSIMGATQDHLLYPAHAHLNLLGFVTLSIMGGFYAISPNPPGRLAWANLILSAGGVAVMIPMLAYLLSGHDKQMGPLMPIPEGLVILGMICFLVNVLRSGRKAG